MSDHLEYVGTKAVISAAGAVVKDVDVVLNSGLSMPVLGLGTYLIKNQEDIEKSLDSALRLGYRLFDTATSYGNEEFIGPALYGLLPNYNLERKDIFITSKLSPRDLGKGKTKQAVISSLRKLRLKYIDLYLIHWPGGANLDVTSTDNKRLRHEAWAELETCVEDGLIKSIGVSNFNLSHLNGLLKVCKLKPAVNQVEFHVFYRYPNDFLKFAAENNILLQSYATLGGHKNQELLENPTIKKVSASLKVAPSQVLLRWALQKGWGE